jgi:hypothetical protein
MRLDKAKNRGMCNFVPGELLWARDANSPIFAQSTIPCEVKWRRLADIL